MSATDLSTVPRTPDDAPVRPLLGIDPGTRALGWGAVLPPARFVACGTLRPLASARAADRLGRLLLDLEELLARLRPTVVAVETGYAGRHPKAALRLGEARGVAIAAAARAGAEVVEVPPASAKLAVTGSGRASKTQVAGCVARLLRVNLSGASEDATDALAVALAAVLRGPGLANARPFS